MDIYGIAKANNGRSDLLEVLLSDVDIESGGQQSGGTSSGNGSGGSSSGRQK